MARNLFFSVLVLFIPAICFAQSNNTESLTVTTYYPAPYGVYRNMRLYPSQEPTNGVGPGVMYFNATAEKLYIYINDTTRWVTVSGEASAGDGLVYNLHTKADCKALGGNVTDTDVSAKQCQFNLPVCPTGWKQYLNYTKVSGLDCTCVHPSSPGYCTGNPCVEACTNTRTWGDNAPITRYTDWTCWVGEDSGTWWYGCNPNIIQIGCY